MGKRKRKGGGGGVDVEYTAAVRELSRIVERRQMTQADMDSVVGMAEQLEGWDRVDFVQNVISALGAGGGSEANS